MISYGPIKTIKDAAEAFEQVRGLGKLSMVDERFMETVLDKMRCCAKAREIADVNHLSSNIKKGPMEVANEILAAGEAEKKGK